MRGGTDIVRHRLQLSTSTHVEILECLLFKVCEEMKDGSDHCTSNRCICVFITGLILAKLLLKGIASSINVFGGGGRGTFPVVVPWIIHLNFLFMCGCARPILKTTEVIIFSFF